MCRRAGEGNSAEGTKRLLRETEEKYQKGKYCGTEKGVRRWSHEPRAGEPVARTVDVRSLELFLDVASLEAGGSARADGACGVVEVSLIRLQSVAAGYKLSSRRLTRSSSPWCRRCRRSTPPERGSPTWSHAQRNSTTSCEEGSVSSRRPMAVSLLDELLHGV